MLNKILCNGLKTALALSVSTTASILIASTIENGAPWSALNCITHIIDGDDKEQPTEFSPRSSLLGLSLNATAMIIWGIAYEACLHADGKKSTPVTSIVATSGAVVTDYLLVPKRFTPGIEKKLSFGGVAASYLVIAATLALSPLWNDYDDNRNPETAITA
jgi:hypothetical protein